MTNLGQTGLAERLSEQHETDIFVRQPNGEATSDLPTTKIEAQAERDDLLRRIANLLTMALGDVRDQVPLSEARNKFAATIDRAIAGETLSLTDHGRDKVIMISIHRFDAIMQIVHMYEIIQKRQTD
jgi:prevent-host-death family protein